MCELMTISAAAAFTVWHFAAGRRNNAVFTTMLMFWGAALMWSVDCVAGAFEGEPLLDLSRHDFMLGAIILAAGLSVFAILSALQRRNARSA